MTHYSIFASPVGFGGVVAGERGLIEVFLPFEAASREETEGRIRGRYPDLLGESPLTREAGRLLGEYFAGKRVSFDLQIDTEGFTPFQKKVYAAVGAIDYGTVKSYGEVAGLVGNPRAARGIGVAMARNPLPIIIPCHRVVGAGGEMTGYSGAGGVGSKKWLLLMEGVEVERMPRRRRNSG